MPGPAPADGRIIEVAQQLLECSSAALAETAEGAPAHAYLVPGGQVAWDWCHCGGQLTVHIRTAYPSDSFPTQLLTETSCLATYTVVEYVVTVLRCGPTQDGHGNPPPGADINAAGLVDFTDRTAVRRAVSCCPLDDGNPARAKTKRVLQEHLGVGQGGQCVGSELHVLVGLLNCGEC